ncbi:MAG: trypsin-like peptidase domain-containing protein [Thermomicrobiales bacterium]|nr:trypsin-like peptidase domain-containing protein [Thermomicrobiales bacterium]
MYESTPRSFNGIIKRSAIGAALVLGLAGGTIGTALLPEVSAQGTSTDAITQQTGSFSVADIVEQVNPAVVTVTNLQTMVNPYTGQSTSDAPVAVGSGSGFIISEDGYLVTNYHVTQGGEAFEVRLLDGTIVPATYVGGDQLQDVAVLKLELEAGQTVPAVAPLGDASQLRAGDEVVAIGSPYGELTNSVTTGIVNATGRDLDTGAGYALPNLIQHDADIYPGNSGGPLLNAEGEVIGINVAKATYTTGMNQTDSIGFAISIDAARAIIDGVIEDGQYDRAYLGVEAQPVASFQNRGQAAQVAGQQIMTILEGGPAAEAGLQPGDIVTAVNDVTIDQDNRFINLVVLDHDPGDTISLTVMRDGQEMTIEVTLGVRPAELDQ